MTKEEIENYIYDKMIQIGVTKHLEGEEYLETLFDDLRNFLQHEKKWYIRTTKDLDTDYYSIELTSWNSTNERVPDSYLYVCEEDILNDIIDNVRRIKLEEIL